MDTTLWQVTTRCSDPAREDEFNRWYDEVHLPDLLSVPGIVAARRYRVAPARGAEPSSQYLAVYEIEAENPEAVLQSVFTEYAPKWRDANRVIDCMEGVSSTLCTPLGARQQATVGSTGN
jgi:hypothetical protein